MIMDSDQGQEQFIYFSKESPEPVPLGPVLPRVLMCAFEGDYDLFVRREIEHSFLAIANARLLNPTSWCSPPAALQCRNLSGCSSRDG